MADNHVSMAVVFDVPEGKEFKSKFGELYNLVKGGTADCLYYGFATLGNKVICREGYTDGKAVLQHMKEVKSTLEGILAEVGKDKMKILCMGTQADLDLLSPHLSSYGARMINLDSGAFWESGRPQGADTHVTVLPEFIVPEDRFKDFVDGFPKFYAATKAGAGAAGMLYYGFGTEGTSVFCREGYKNAESVLQHGRDVKDLLEEPMKVVGAGGMKLNVLGPQSELDKLRPVLESRGAIFWELDDGALWR